jgi:ribosomal protein L3 glutamine methyltransferase
LSKKFAVTAARNAAEMQTAIDMMRWTASTLAREQVFFGHGYDNAIDEAIRLVLHCLDLPVGTPDTLLGGRLTTAEREGIVTMLSRRVVERVPLAYLTGQASYAGLEFVVTQDVLIPRSPIIEMIEASFAPWAVPESVNNILEIGTGSGCIAVACARQFPDADVVATDVSEAALEIARINVYAYGLEQRIELRQADVWAAVDETFDVIVSNPPYVTHADLDGAPPEFAHEPRLALAAGEDGLDIAREIIRGAARHLNDGGVLVMEVGVTQPYLEDSFPELPFTWLEFERGGEGVFVLERDALSAMGFDA